MRNVESIKELDWKKAKGVKYTGTQTNSMLTSRDYTIKCKTDYCIDIIHGVWIWFCTTHHQPNYMCEIDKLKKHIDDNVLVELKMGRGKEE